MITGWHKELLTLAADYEIGEDLSWTPKGDDFQFWIRCNDLFWWGTADAEEVTEETLPVLRESLKDLAALGKERLLPCLYGGSLYCARVRKLRPQGACYPKDAPEVWPLFDACGPEREKDMANPYAPGERK